MAKIALLSVGKFGYSGLLPAFPALIRTTLSHFYLVSHSCKGLKMTEPVGDIKRRKVAGFALSVGGKAIAALLLVWLFLTLTACGFHLRGLDANGQIRPLAFSFVKIEPLGTVDGRLLQQLKQQLQAQGVRLVPSETQAQVRLKLSATQFQRIITAKNGQGQVTAELLKLRQPFTLVAVVSGKVVEQGVAMSYRDRSIDPNALLAAERELASQQNLMRQEVVQQIMQRLSEVAPQQLEKASEPPVLPAKMPQPSVSP